MRTFKELLIDMDVFKQELEEKINKEHLRLDQRIDKIEKVVETHSDHIEKIRNGFKGRKRATGETA